MDSISPRGGIVRAARRPAGWTPPPPEPVTPAAPRDLWPSKQEDLCWLAGNWRILQRTDGHRFSVDDLVTAHFAVTALGDTPPRRILDLGCGIGSVLLFLAWRFPKAVCVGVEAQEISVALARRSIAWNGADAGRRVVVRHADFRAAESLASEAPFELVTGTPPYFRPGAGTESTAVQRAACRFEHRGGIEDYCAAAASMLAPGAPFVACESSGQRPRVEAAARSAGLALASWCDVIPREGKDPLFSVFSLRRSEAPTGPVAQSSLVVRDRAGRRTAAFVTLRAAMGLPP